MSFRMTAVGSAVKSPASFEVAVSWANLSTSASDTTTVEASGSLGIVVDRRAHNNQSGGSAARERVVRVADSDTVREWT
jgi:hypothetical protein